MLSLFLSMLENDEQKNKFQEIYNTYQENLFSITLAITKNYYDAEDALQNAWYSIAKNIDSIKMDDITILKSFLQTVVRNAAINLCKERSRKSFDSIDLYPNLESTEDLYKEIEGDEQYRMLLKQMDFIPDIFRDVLILNLIVGLSCTKIAELLGLNKNTVKSRLTKGKKLFMNLVRERRDYEKK